MTQKYLLYVGPLQDIAPDIEFSYYDCRRGYLFVLADHKPDGKYAVMTDELMREMSDSEIAWYNKSCMVLNARWVAAHEEEARDRVEAFLAEFEEELKREAAKAKEIEQNGAEEDSREGISSGSD